MKDELVQIRITKRSKAVIVKRSKKLGLKQITVLEYILQGKLPPINNN